MWEATFVHTSHARSLRVCHFTLNHNYLWTDITWEEQEGGVPGSWIWPNQPALYSWTWEEQPLVLDKLCHWHCLQPNSTLVNFHLQTWQHYKVWTISMWIELTFYCEMKGVKGSHAVFIYCYFPLISSNLQNLRARLFVGNEHVMARLFTFKHLPPSLENSNISSQRNDTAG